MESKWRIVPQPRLLIRSPLNEGVWVRNAAMDEYGWPRVSEILTTNSSRSCNALVCEQSGVGRAASFNVSFQSKPCHCLQLGLKDLI